MQIFEQATKGRWEVSLKTSLISLKEDYLSKVDFNLTWRKLDSLLDSFSVLGSIV